MPRGKHKPGNLSTIPVDGLCRGGCGAMVENMQQLSSNNLKEQQREIYCSVCHISYGNVQEKAPEAA